MDGVGHALRVGDMALGPGHPERGAQRAAPPHLDDIAQPFLAAGLADEAPVDALAARAEDLDHPPRAVDGRAFLIARQEKRQRSARLGVGGEKPLRCRDHGREPAFHIRRPAAIEASVADLGHEGVAVPGGQGTRGNHIGVARQHQERAFRPAPGPQVVEQGRSAGARRRIPGPRAAPR